MGLPEGKLEAVGTPLDACSRMGGVMMFGMGTAAGKVAGIRASCSKRQESCRRLGGAGNAVRVKVAPADRGSGLTGDCPAGSGTGSLAAPCASRLVAVETSAVKAIIMANIAFASVVCRTPCPFYHSLVPKRFGF